MSNRERLLFPEEVADWLGVSKRFLSSETRAGRIVCAKFGGQKGRRYDPDEVRRYISACTEIPPGQSPMRRRIFFAAKRGTMPLTPPTTQPQT